MKLKDFGILAGLDDKTRNAKLDQYLQELYAFSRGRVSFMDNLEGQFIQATIQTTSTRIGHSLGKVPTSVMPLMVFPYGTSTFTFGNPAPTLDAIYIAAGVAGTYNFYIF